MKNRVVNGLLCLSAAAMLGTCTPAVLMAAETGAAETAVSADAQGNQTEASVTAIPSDTQDGQTEASDTQEGQTETAADGSDEEQEERIPEDVTVTLQTGDVVLKNETERFFSQAEYVRAESKVVEVQEAATSEEQGSEVVAQTWNLILTEEDGTIHTFEDVRADKWTEPVLTEAFGFLYVEYQDEESVSQEASETGEEKELEEPVTVYATTEVNIRKTADVSDDSVKVTTLGAEWTALASLPGWVKVEGDGVTGYVRHEYVTEDKAAIDALLAEKQGTATVTPAAAQTTQSSQETASYQTPTYNYQTPASTQPAATQPAETEPTETEPTETEPTETEPETPEEPDEVAIISREEVVGDDGNSYYEITHEDGSVTYEEQ